MLGVSWIAPPNGWFKSGYVDRTICAKYEPTGLVVYVWHHLLSGTPVSLTIRANAARHASSNSHLCSIGLMHGKFSKLYTAY
jgi:hypothetical protein